MKKTGLFLLIILTICIINANSVYSALPEKAGVFNFKINGVQYSIDLFSEVTPYSYDIFAGNKNFEIRISWMYINTPDNIFTSSSELNESNGNIKVKYIDFLSPLNFWTHAGKIAVTGNDGKKISGEFNFIATGIQNYYSSSKSNNTSGSNTECSVTDGTFEFNYLIKK